MGVDCVGVEEKRVDWLKNNQTVSYIVLLVGGECE